MCQIAGRLKLGEQGACVCPAGQYARKVWTISQCFQCPKGQYSKEADQDKCTACPNGKTTFQEGASSETDCKEASNLNFDVNSN